MDANEIQAQFRTATQFFQQGRYAEALQLLDALDAAQPNTPNILYPRAVCLDQLDRRVEALEVCDLLITHFADQRAAQLKQQLLVPKKNVLATPPPRLKDGVLPRQQAGGVLPQEAPPDPRGMLTLFGILAGAAVPLAGIGVALSFQQTVNAAFSGAAFLAAALTWALLTLLFLAPGIRRQPFLLDTWGLLAWMAAPALLMLGILNVLLPTAGSLSALLNSLGVGRLAGEDGGLKILVTIPFGFAFFVLTILATFAWTGLYTGLSFIYKPSQLIAPIGLSLVAVPLFLFTVFLKDVDNTEIAAANRAERDWAPEMSLGPIAWICLVIWTITIVWIAALFSAALNRLVVAPLRLPEEPEGL